MTFQPFLMERMMSRFEQQVDYNLSESGVHPVKLRELLGRDQESWDRLLEVELNYPHVNGIPELRDNIAALYPEASAENVLVTVGAIEANYISIRALLSEGDQILVMLPNYMQIWGISKNHGYDLQTFHLQEEEGWTLDRSEFDSQITSDTKLIAVCNPNNPTGKILSEEEMDLIVTGAERVGAWILADEVYRGATRVLDEENPSFFGRYDRVLAVGSMSKAYGLPGLRLGWVVAPAPVVDQIWARHEYVTISASMLSNKLAALALAEDVRPWLLERARDYIRRGFPVLQEWIERHSESFCVNPPDASAVAFMRYSIDVNSTEFCDRLRKEKSVLMVPGDHFGMDHYLRVSFGLPGEYLREALERLNELVAELSTH